MPFYSAIVVSTVRMVFVVEAENAGQARQLIDDEDDATICIVENESDYEIEPGSLQEASPEEVKKYKKELARMGE